MTYKTSYTFYDGETKNQYLVVKAKGGIVMGRFEQIRFGVFVEEGGNQHIDFKTAMRICNSRVAEQERIDRTIARVQHEYVGIDDEDACDEARLRMKQGRW